MDSDAIIRIKEQTMHLYTVSPNGNVLYDITTKILIFILSRLYHNDHSCCPFRATPTYLYTHLFINPRQPSVTHFYNCHFKKNPYRWNHTTFRLFFPSQFNSLKIIPGYYMYQQFITFYCWVAVHGIGILQFI